jgi:hypothetical protein
VRLEAGTVIAVARPESGTSVHAPPRGSSVRIAWRPESMVALQAG